MPSLLVLQCRRKLTAAERREALRLLRVLPVSVDDEAARLTFDRVAELAEREALSIYDAVYLELAIRRALPLCCNDGPLRAAAKRNSVDLDPE